MKSNKTAGKNKDLQKSSKKELQQNLSSKFFEAVKSLGHDTEKIAEDLLLVSKFVAKKLSRKVNAGKKEATKKVAAVSVNPVVSKKDVPAKKEVPKGVKKAQKVVQKASARVKPVVNSVKVPAIASEEKLKDVIRTAKTQPSTAKSSPKKTKPEKGK